MAVKVNLDTYYKENVKHSYQTGKVSILRSSDKKFGNHLLSLLDDTRDDFFGLVKDVPKKFIHTVRRNLPIIKKIASNQNFYEHSLLQTNKSIDKIKLKSIHTGMTIEPINQVNSSSRKIEDLSNVFNYLYDTKSNLYVYMMTLTIPNISMFYYSSIMLGKKKGSHRAFSFPDLVRSLFKYFSRHYSEIRGSSKNFETTINHDKLVMENPYGILHPHCHCLMVTDSKLNVDSAKKAFFSEWSKLCKKHGMDVSGEAFDLEEIYSNDGSDSFSKAISEATKYILKPDFYKDFPEEPTSFSRDLFASLMTGSYGFKNSSKTGDISDAYSSLKNSGSLEAPINFAMNGNSNFNFSGNPVFPSIVTKDGQMTYADGDKEVSHFKISNVFDMSYRRTIYFNKDIIAGVLLNSNQDSQVRASARKFASKYRYSFKKEKFDSVVEFIKKIPFYNSSDEFLDMISSVAKRYLDKGIQVAFKDIHAYRLWKDRYDDLCYLIRAIRYYDDGTGYLHLGFHTNPNLKYKIFNWISAYKSSLNLKKYNWSRAWCFYAHVHNGDHSILRSEFTDDEYQAFMVAMQDAEHCFGMYDSVQPAEKACSGMPFCFVKVANRIKGDGFGQNTGEILTPVHYNQLTARINDDVNYDETGSKWDVNLFANISKSNQADKCVYGLLKPFLKKKRSKNVKS